MRLMDEITAYQRLREHLGLNQAQFGVLIGVSHQRVSQLEAWQGCLAPGKLKKLAARNEKDLQALGLTVTDFLEERWF
jgi:hypothetical protein